MLLFIELMENGTFHQHDFNTSHVTVYRYCYRCVNSIRIFQYISCYCLSYNHNILPALLIYFNTSHVTVYHMLRNPDNAHQCISIHLMLLFIFVRTEPVATIALFQYISCYCLSTILCRRFI